MKKLCLVLVLCLGLLLAGCGEQNEIQKPVYTVTFSINGQVCSEQRVQEGHLPRSVLTNIPGVRFVQWLTEDGEPVNPYTVYVGKDTRYVAEAYPELSKHVPFLFVDETNKIRPDAVLTADELSMALHALASEEAADHFPGMPAGNMGVTRDVLANILKSFFPAMSVAEEISSEDTKPVTRSEFAYIMCRLLGRGGSEVFGLSNTVKLPADITREREDAAYLLEASVVHNPGVRQYRWSNVPLPAQFEPGFVIMDGWLYYVQANYLFLKNAEVDGFRFGADGRYTSGDARLDQVVAEVLGELVQENPNANRRTLLRLAFDKCSSYETLNKGSLAFGETGWEKEEALIMLLDEKGDCYNYAAAFWALARALGFDARVVSGKCGADQVPHGWVVITMEGRDYTFDPERQHTRFWQDWYMISPEAAMQWRYTSIESP